MLSFFGKNPLRISNGITSIFLVKVLLDILEVALLYRNMLAWFNLTI